MVNINSDLIYVSTGTVKLYLRELEKNDKSLFLLNLRPGDYIDPLCPLTHFRTTRILSINKKVREMSLVKLVIQHSIWEEDITSYFRVPSPIYHMYVNNKNYLSIFSKEDIDLFLNFSFPDAVDL